MDEKLIWYNCDFCQKLCSQKDNNSINGQFHMCNSCFIEYMKILLKRNKRHQENKSICKTSREYSEQKQIVLKHWGHLIQEFDKLIPMIKNRGGTLGHRFGSVGKSLIRLRALIIDF